MHWWPGCGEDHGCSEPYLCIGSWAVGRTIDVLNLIHALVAGPWGGMDNAYPCSRGVGSKDLKGMKTQV